MNSLKEIVSMYRRCSWRQFLFVFFLSSILGLVLVQTEISDALYRGENGLTWQPWIWTYTSVYGYALLSPILIYFCTKWPLEQRDIMATSTKLLALYFPFTWLFITVMLCLRHLSYLAIEGTFFDGGELLTRYIYEFPKAVGIYVAIVFITYTRIYFQSTQQEQLSAAILKGELQASKMQVLRNQLQPHFLFNTLNLISSTMYQNVDKADSIIARLADLLRYSLSTEETPFVTVQKEVQAMTSYLDIAKLRFDERLTVHMNIDPQAQHCKIPAMLLQPLLENAVKFGVEPSNKNGLISLNINVINERIHIEITNPCIQVIKPMESFGIGLGNTKNRLELLYHEAASVNLHNNDDKHITVSIILPVQENNND